MLQNIRLAKEIYSILGTVCRVTGGFLEGAVFYINLPGTDELKSEAIANPHQELLDIFSFMISGLGVITSTAFFVARFNLPEYKDHDASIYDSRYDHVAIADLFCYLQNRHYIGAAW